MCKTAERVVGLLEPFRKDPRLAKSFQPGLKRRDPSAVAWANLYPKPGLEADLYKDVAAAVEAGIRKSVLDCGEVQTLEGRGENVDIGLKQALLGPAKWFEVYCFNCYSTSFIRVHLEEGLTKDKRGHKWVSVDVDETGTRANRSLWFED